METSYELSTLVNSASPINLEYLDIASSYDPKDPKMKSLKI